MKRTTITLPEPLAQAVEREARRRRVSVSAIARDALAGHLGLDPDSPRELPFVALGRSGQSNIAHDFEEILAAEWDRDLDSDR